MYSIIKLIIAVILTASCAYAGWTEDFLLNDNHFEINPQVVARNDTIHVVWDRLTHDSISYIRSTNGGMNWNNDIAISEEDHQTFSPDISIGQNGMLVSWLDVNLITGFKRIAIRTSADGNAWDDPIYRITDYPRHFTLPATTVMGDSIFIVYRSLRPDSTGEDPFRFMYSSDYGITWSDEISIGYPPSNVQDLLIQYCNGVLMAVWAGFVDTLHVGYHVVGYRSTDAGQTWSDMIWISPEHIQNSAQDACIACNEETGQLAVGYMDYRYQIYPFHGDIFVAISDDGGLTWPLEVMATENHAAWDPDIDFAGDTLVVVWSDRQNYDEGQHEIYFNRSDNLGMTWEGEYRLTYAMGQSYAPWISMDNGKIHVVWNDDDRAPDLYSEIFYKRFDPDPTGVIDSANLRPTDFSIAAYPNPFNAHLNITVNSTAPGSIVIYDILGRIIREFSYSNGQSSFIWNADDLHNNPVSSGIYFISMKGGSRENSIRVLYLK
ncbi:MAG: T9SS type A sorting domain-containing protein [Candidatus Zixiibacteriota bacterium]|nr:MAG: T9SS type A sorting domain-containing protein [candidate division Zixibacteria bacterium]